MPPEDGAAKTDQAEIESWADFQAAFADAASPRRWIYRGSRRRSLISTLERACRDSGIDLVNAPGIERLLVREFRRNYRGAEAQIVATDTLFCMGLMRHYGAPTRLLDWTYSPHIALFFAIKDGLPSEDGPHRGRHVAQIWELDTRACREAALAAADDKPLRRRFGDEGVQDDATFRAVYLEPPARQFVLPENPWTFHERHRVQQGVFLCPGDVSAPYEDNLAALGVGGGSDGPALRRYTIALTPESRRDILLQLLRGNITEASLFPGLDGFARSLGHRLPLLLRQLQEEG